MHNDQNKECEKNKEGWCGMSPCIPDTHPCTCVPTSEGEAAKDRVKQATDSVRSTLQEYFPVQPVKESSEGEECPQASFPMHDATCSCKKWDALPSPKVAEKFTAINHSLICDKGGVCPTCRPSTGEGVTITSENAGFFAREGARITKASPPKVAEHKDCTACYGLKPCIMKKPVVAKHESWERAFDDLCYGETPQYDYLVDDMHSSIIKQFIRTLLASEIKAAEERGKAEGVRETVSSPDIPTEVKYMFQEKENRAFQQGKASRDEELAMKIQEARRSLAKTTIEKAKEQSFETTYKDHENNDKHIQVIEIFDLHTILFDSLEPDEKNT